MARNTFSRDDFPSCCKAQIVHGLSIRKPDANCNCGSCGTLDTDLTKWQKELRRHIIESQEACDGVLIAITTTDQKMAAKALEAEGFKRSEDLNKRHHIYGTKLILWWRNQHDDNGEPVPCSDGSVYEPDDPDDDPSDW